MSNYPQKRILQNITTNNYKDKLLLSEFFDVDPTQIEIKIDGNIWLTNGWADENSLWLFSEWVEGRMQKNQVNRLTGQESVYEKAKARAVSIVSEQRDEAEEKQEMTSYHKKCDLARLHAHAKNVLDFTRERLEREL